MKKKLTLLLIFICNVVVFASESRPATVNVVEITDVTLENVFYHQMHFTEPTKLVFTNLTSVNGFVYFHQNTNLVEVDFPLLIQTGKYFYFHQNVDLETVNAPLLNTVHEYLHAYENTSLTTFNVCALQQILSVPGSFSTTNMYYHISGNTPAVDTIPSCFSLGGPQNLSLSNASVAENEPLSTVVGILSADSNYPVGSLTYYLEEYIMDNRFFKILDNQLVTNSTFDYETDHEYSIRVSAINQLGEKITVDLVINITDVANENIQTVEISDTTLENVYYHQVSFTEPTRLVFTNLTSVSGYVYFNQNVNLVSVSFPLLEETGRSFYVYENNSLLSLNAPSLTTIHDYLFVSNNNTIEELNVCNLVQILPIEEDIYSEPYYYIANNPNLEFESTCLEHTTIGFIAVPEIVIEPAPNTLLGTFTSDAGDDVAMAYYFCDSEGNPAVNNDFIIVEDRLYLARNHNEYAHTDFNIHIGATRTSGASKTGIGLNERLALPVSINISETLGIKSFDDKAMALFPNPATDYFEIKTDTNIETAVIFDMTGRKLIEVQPTNNRVNTTTLPQGNYIVVLKTATHQIINKKLVKK